MAANVADRRSSVPAAYSPQNYFQKVLEPEGHSVYIASHGDTSERSIPIPRTKVRRLARLLNNEQQQGANARLSNWTGSSLATVKGWQAEASAEHHRSMSATAQRLLAVLAYMQAEGTLDDTTMDKIKKIEAHLVAGQGRLNRFLEQLTGKKVETDEDRG